MQPLLTSANAGLAASIAGRVVAAMDAFLARSAAETLATTAVLTSVVSGRMTCKLLAPALNVCTAQAPPPCDRSLTAHRADAGNAGCAKEQATMQGKLVLKRATAL
eukprot:356602-Chlamydomonas_euryale.AAC.6